MTRKCWNCGTTKGLKALTRPDCDCGKCDGWHNSSVCKSCYFSEDDFMSCEMDGHSITACLEDVSCENHKDSILRKEHWDELDYNYKEIHFSVEVKHD